MGNQASEDKLRAELVQYLESTYQDGAVMATRPNSGYHKRVDEFTDKLLALIRTEKLKLLAEVRERVIEQAKPDKRKATSWQQGIEVSAYEDAVRVYEYKMNEQLTQLEAEL